MQTYTQTFAAAQSWELNVPGKYFTTLGCTNVINVKFFKAGKKLDLGDITGLLAGLEVQNIDFDRVVIDVTAADTITVGIGNGNARYNRAQGSVTITSNKVAQMAPTQGLSTVTNVSANLKAANTARQYLFIMNRDAAGTIYINWQATATAANGIPLAPGQWIEMAQCVPTGTVRAIGDIASNANVLVVEG